MRFTFLFNQAFIVTVCGNFPKIENAVKKPIKYAAINSIHKTEVSVNYTCNEGYYYSLDNPIVSCAENGFDNEFGKCLKGKLYYFTLLIKLLFSV